MPERLTLDQYHAALVEALVDADPEVRDAVVAGVAPAYTEFRAAKARIDARIEELLLAMTTSGTIH